VLLPFLFASRAAAGAAALDEFHAFCRAAAARALARPPPAAGERAAWAQLWRLARGGAGARARGGGDGGSGSGSGGGGVDGISEAQVAAEVATLIVGG
jgi:hypothetical protein